MHARISSPIHDTEDTSRPRPPAGLCGGAGFPPASTWSERAATYCASKVGNINYTNYATLSSAQSACSSNKACVAVSDGQCNGAPYNLCSSVHGSSQGSCTYTKVKPDSGQGDTGLHATPRLLLHVLVRKICTTPTTYHGYNLLYKLR